jgi:hypothetical protein
MKSSIMTLKLAVPAHVRCFQVFAKFPLMRESLLAFSSALSRYIV